MARYREVADDLRAKIVGGAYPLGSSLPPIAHLQDDYDVRGLNTIRQAQRILIDEGMIETRPGIGVFVISAEPQPPAINMLAELRAARASLDRAIMVLERAGDD